ncbi:hypothetical protein MKW98_021820 [Papaver atlanticum]|uniref:RecQ-mediated genome instability protein 1 C-terminal OB-fold domain-containing protein n=1 Tax=Papaver atlanticum TaxID=357466 RepID=A0AAD4S2X4_9MAGN|nr:hypothetical protein MKW98_021820 [Papaver atlanticum]
MPLLRPLHKVPGSQQETEIPNVESRVAAGLDKISVVGCPEAMSEMDIIEEKFAGYSRIPGIERPSHNDVPGNWENRKNDYNTPIRYKIKCVVYGIAEFWFKNGATYECLVNVADGSRKSMVRIPLEIVEKHYSPKQGAVMSHQALNTKLRSFQGTMLVEMNKNSPVPVALEINDEKISFDFRWFLGPQRTTA